ncbi:hypothetical protein FACS18949_12070 [Clostridia bacterium]|nr:hypothetical protein FACS18949_12070 [Clostridia bacterium]
MENKSNNSTVISRIAQSKKLSVIALGAVLAIAQYIADFTSFIISVAVTRARYYPIMSIIFTLIVTGAILVLFTVIIKKEKVNANIGWLLVVTIATALLLYFIRRYLYLPYSLYYYPMITGFSGALVYLNAKPINPINPIKLITKAQLQAGYSFAADRQAILSACEPLVKVMLKAPLTAIFCQPEELSIVETEAGQYTIFGNVNAQNSHGALIRTGFRLTATCENGEWRVVKAKMENQFAKVMGFSYALAILITLLLFGLFYLIFSSLL